MRELRSLTSRAILCSYKNSNDSDAGYENYSLTFFDRVTHLLPGHITAIDIFLHFSDGGMSNELWLLKGTSVSAKNSPNPGKCNGSFFNLIGLHGIFMFLGWGLLLQLGAFIARYLRHKDPLWFLLHRALQVLVY